MKLELDIGADKLTITGSLPPIVLVDERVVIYDIVTDCTIFISRHPGHLNTMPIIDSLVNHVHKAVDTWKAQHDSQ